MGRRFGVGRAGCEVKSCREAALSRLDVALAEIVTRVALVHHEVARDDCAWDSVVCDLGLLRIALECAEDAAEGFVPVR